MNRKQLADFIFEKYGSREEYLWKKFQTYSICRHKNNRKWFVIFMDIPKNKLGLEGNEKVDIINVKCDEIFIGSFRDEKAIFPAYHMNKAKWVSIILDGSLEDDKLIWFVEQSYKLTENKK